MARAKGAKNKIAIALPEVCNMTAEQRIEFLANLIIDRILDDQTTNKTLYQIIERQGYANLPTNR
jgi:hypothetical protein